ncbi:MAG: helix-turn-helix transcriptional regulator [Oscillospiraceae bacterium]
MDTLSKIFALLKEKGYSQKDLTEHLGLSKGNFSEWKAGRSESYKKYIFEIAEFLNVSTDYLLGRIDDPTDPDDEDILNNTNLEVTEHFSGDARKIKEFYDAVDQDAMNEPPRSEALFAAFGKTDDDFSEEEIKQINNFIKFVKNQRSN